MKRLLLSIVSCLFLATAGSQVLQLYSIDTQRQTGGDHGYTLNGPHMSLSRDFLFNTMYFGPQGSYNKSVVIRDTFATSNSLSGISAIGPRTIFFFGTFDKNNGTTKPFTEEELDSVYAWSRRGGRIIHTSGLTFLMNNADMRLMNEHYGFEMTSGSAEELIPVPAIAGNPPFNGPFGPISKVSQGAAAQGYYSKLPANSHVLAADGAGRPTLVMDCNTMDILVADVDVVSNLNPEAMSFSTTSASTPQKFLGNLLAFMDLLPDPPLLVRNGSQLSVTGSYAGYQWYHNGSAVAGATSSQFSAPATGTTYVMVDVAGGCKVPSDAYTLNDETGVTAAECNPDVPTAFSPDNNGQNDKACVHGDCITSLDFKIFDRWGQLVFAGTRPGECWDGTLAGKALGTGVFAWTFKAVLNGSTEVNKKGHITLIR